MIKKIRYCDICGKRYDDVEYTNGTVSLKDRYNYFHTEKQGFTLSIDVCGECQKALQGTIDHLANKAGTLKTENVPNLTSVNTFEECLRVFGAECPLDGQKALDVLFEVLWYLKEQRVIDSFDSDRIDRIISETAY